MKYRVILLDTQEAPDIYSNVNSSNLSDAYDGSDLKHCFFCQEFEVPDGVDHETAVLIGRGILFNNDFTSDDTVSTIERVQ